MSSQGGMIEQLENRVLLSSSWFVSATGGSDANPGTLAQPFASIQRAADVAQPGDTVEIRGGTYYESVVPANSGTPSAPITYQAYNGEAVTVDGADPDVGWTQSSGSIYATAQGWDLGDGNNQVFVDGQMLTEARFPNSGLDPMHPTTMPASYVSASVNPNGLSTAIIFNPALDAPPNYWVGATMHISPGQDWVWQTGTVIASTPTNGTTPASITYQYQQLTPYEVPKPGDPFYLTGKLQMLDNPGEFYHDPNTGQIYLWDQYSDNPAAHQVEAKIRQYGFDLSSRAYINVQGIRLFACSINTDNASNHITLDGLMAAFVSHRMDNPNPWNVKFSPHTTGIILNGNYNSLVNSTVAYSSGDGVFLGGAYNTVQNCTIAETNYAAGDEAAISILGSADTIAHSTIYDTGRSGITFYFSPHVSIVNNVIHGIGLLTTDAGGVYTWSTDGQTGVVAYNIIYDAFSEGYGNTGIFLDDNTTNVFVHHNLVYNVNNALKMNLTCSGNRIFNNTLLGNYALATGANAMMPQSYFYNNVFVGIQMFAPGAIVSHNLTGHSWQDGFVDRTNSDYQLAPGSPAIDAGLVLPTYTDGYVGAAPDIGAYEYGLPPFQAGAS